MKDFIFMHDPIKIINSKIISLRRLSKFLPQPKNKFHKYFPRIILLHKPLTNTHLKIQIWLWLISNLKPISLILKHIWIKFIRINLSKEAKLFHLHSFSLLLYVNHIPNLHLVQQSVLHGPLSASPQSRSFVFAPLEVNFLAGFGERSPLWVWWDGRWWWMSFLLKLTDRINN